MLHRFKDLLGIDLPVKITLWSPKRSDHQRAFNESRVMKWRSSTRGEQAMKETEALPRQDMCALCLWLTSCWYLHLHSSEECDVLDLCACCVMLMWQFLLLASPLLGSLLGERGSSHSISTTPFTHLLRSWAREEPLSSRGLRDPDPHGLWLLQITPQIQSWS